MMFLCWIKQYKKKHIVVQVVATKKTQRLIFRSKLKKKKKQRYKMGRFCINGSFYTLYKSSFLIFPFVYI